MTSSTTTAPGPAELAARAVRALRDGGVGDALAQTVAFVYRRGVRPRLPGTPVRYGGIPIGLDRRTGDGRVPDSWLPGERRWFDDDPQYEVTLIGGLRRWVRPGDAVTVIGGGFGVTAVVAAQCAGPGGRVRCYEAAARQAAMVREAAARNGVADRVTVEHAVVARALDVWGAAPPGPAVAPEALPPCDVLEMDCEGAEVEILGAMTIRPRVILVETHGLFGAPTPRVVELLEGLGYRTEVLGIAEPKYGAFCEEKDIRIVAGVRADG